MSMSNKDIFSEIVDVTLYRYNSIDNKIWGILKRDSSHKKLSDDSVIVNSSRLKNHIFNNFKREINRIESMGSGVVHKEATSVYFIWQMLEEMPNLRWVKFTLNNNICYNRIIEVDDIKTIKYSIKTIRGTLRLFDIFEPNVLYTVNAILNDAGIIENNSHFCIIKTSDLIYKLENIMTSSVAMENGAIAAQILQFITDYENDNPEILLVTDY